MKPGDARLGAFATALFALAVAAVLFFRGRGTAPEPQREAALPLPASRLPKRLKQVSRVARDDAASRPGGAAEQTSKQAASPCCGGWDVFATAVGVADRSVDPDELVRMLSVAPAEQRAALACGKVLAPAATAYSLSFDAARAWPHQVTLAAQATAPKSSSSVIPVELPASLEHGRCSVGLHAHAGAACLPTAGACARIARTPYWVSGDLQDVRAFAEQLRAEGGDGGEGATFEWLGNELGAFSTVQLHRDANAFKQAVLLALFTEPFPIVTSTNERKALDEALKDGFWAGALVRRTDHDLVAEVVATDEAKAQKLEPALRAYVETIAARMKGEVPAVVEHGDEPRELLERTAADARVRRRAWRKASVSRDKARVRLQANLGPSDDEARAEQRYQTWLAPKRLAAARLVDALAAGNPPARADLEAIGGADLAVRVERGYRPYFEGDWRCGDDHFAFDAGQAHLGEGRAEPKGPFTYQLQREGAGRGPAEIRLASGELIHVEWHRGLHLRVGDGPERACERLVEAPPEREAPGTIRLELPKPSKGNLFTPLDLERLGLRIERIDATRSLICGFDPGHCLCFEPLACEARGDCPTFEENVAIFESARVPGQARVVSCQRAELGRAGEFRYFYFEGDIHRFEMRWFDARGRLVAQRNVTDYAEYCDHHASGRFMGRVPAADTAVRERLLCGRASTTLLPPLEDLRRLLGTGLELAR